MRSVVRFRNPLPSRPASRRLWSNDEGTAAIEFAMVGLPFLLFVLAIIGYGLYFLTNTYLQHGVESAARVVRTGSSATGGAGGKAMSVGEFRTLVCNYTRPVIDCSKMTVLVQHGTNWSGITPQACTDSKGTMTGSTGAVGDQLSQYAGAQSEVVLITACYKWDLANSFSFLKLGNGADGAGPAIIQAATAFKSEPYAK